MCIPRSGGRAIHRVIVSAVAVEIARNRLRSQSAADFAVRIIRRTDNRKPRAGAKLRDLQRVDRNRPADECSVRAADNCEFVNEIRVACRRKDFRRRLRARQIVEQTRNGRFGFRLIQQNFDFAGRAGRNGRNHLAARRLRFKISA